ncbi:MAG: acyl-CoA dehydrogenase [Chloroflexi bacterium]|nr:acyl-CoA dehydrogenase [Chloroflexota bacterium]
MTRADLYLPPPEHDELTAYLEPRAPAVDTGRIATRELLPFAQRFAPRPRDGRPNGDLLRLARLIASVASSDLSVAFSLWCHHMVLEYLTVATEGEARRELLPLLLRLERIGSTGLAPAMAHVVSGAALPVNARADESGLVLDGKVPWASNLFSPDFVLVTAAAVDGDARAVVLTSDTEGLDVAPFPELVALQATASSSIRLTGARIRSDEIIATDLHAFVARVRPTFLVLQGSFCWGLARRALDEAGAAIDGTHVLAADVAQLEHRASTVATALEDAAHRADRAIRALVALRLEAACLASDAVALELRALGSRAYVRRSSTARRLREAAFLPIQSPTEAQLRAELATA